MRSLSVAIAGAGLVAILAGCSRAGYGETYGDPDAHAGDSDRCDGVDGPDAYCRQTFGADHLCLTAGGTGARCVLQSCEGDRDCTRLDEGCLRGSCDLETHRCTTTPAMAGAACDDGRYCTAVDSCDGQGVCVGTGDPCAGPCTFPCDEELRSCESTPGLDCDDGIECTIGDDCSGAGDCVGVPSDAYCPETGQVCRPGWFYLPSGCGELPRKIALSCHDAAPPGGPATCTVNLPGVRAQADAISCEAYVGLVPVDVTDFLDGQGGCSPEGWLLESGDSCTDHVTACVPTGVATTCCDDWGTICQTGWRMGALALDTQVNCGGGYKQWRLHRTFDTTGLDQLTLCYEVSEAYAVAADAIVVSVEDGTNSEVVSCAQGDMLWRAGSATHCVALPVWAADNPSVKITYIAHVEALGSDHRLYLGGSRLYGWRAGCDARARQVILTEDFVGCPDPMPDDWSGWDVEDAPRCAADVCAGEGAGAFVEDGSWSISRALATSSLAAELQLCFAAGDVAAGDDERITTRVDLGDGDGWQTASSGSPYASVDHQCQPVCVALDVVTPQVARHPSLGLQVTASSSAAGKQAIVDELVVSGLQNCPAAGEVVLSSAVEIGGGVYQLEVSNRAGEPLVAEVVCSWDAVDPPLTASTFVPLR